MKKKIFKPSKIAKKGEKVLPKAVLKKSRKAVLVKKEISPIAKKIISLSNLYAPKGAHRHRKIKGRGSGSGHGKTATRGSKGQTSRAGRHFYLGFEGGQSPLIRRFPKRGFTNIFKKEYQIVNLRDLNRLKVPSITLELLEEKGLIRNKEKLVKVLGEGKVTTPMSIQAHAFSKKAALEIKNAGGKVEILNV